MAQKRILLITHTLPIRDIYRKLHNIFHLTMFTKHIPNTITCLNLLSGCVAVISALTGNIHMVVWCIALSAIFDFCDGLAARLLHAYSPMGKELDSLADLISFGLAPALMLYTTLQEHLPQHLTWMAYASLLIPIFAALRLAKFNIDDNQSTTFSGLPVPANALWWIGACRLLTENNNDITTWSVTASILLFSYLMICNLPMFSLKFKGLQWRGNEIRYIMIAASTFLLLWQGVTGCASVIGLYILLSILCKKLSSHRS